MRVTLYNKTDPAGVFEIQTTQTAKELSEFLETTISHQQPIRLKLFNGSYLILQYSEYEGYRVLVSE